MTTGHGPTTLEAIVLGRNDDYEPGWVDRLHATIDYNRKLFEGTRIDFRVAFVEWNPPAERPLLAPDLLARFPFLRAVVVDAAVHEELCEAPELSMMLNFSINAAVRSSTADFLVITGGDIFFGRALSRRIIEQGLEHRCLYRAERVNIVGERDWTELSTDDIESPQHVVSVDVCTEPPFDVPPFTNACGDFILLDRAHMAGIRGFDEGIRAARLHLDSRCCFTAMFGVPRAEVLGRIYHISHRRSYVTLKDEYPGKSYAYDENLPYLNPDDWGLAGFRWEREGDRLWRVHAARDPAMSTVPQPLRNTARQVAAQVRRDLEDVRNSHRPATPAHPEMVGGVSELSSATTHEDWKSEIRIDRGAVRVRTSTSQWAYAVLFPLAIGELEPEYWYWVRVRLQIVTGAIGLGLFVDERMVYERHVGADDDVVNEYLPIDEAPNQLIMRNVAPDDVASEVVVMEVVIERSRKPVLWRDREAITQ